MENQVDGGDEDQIFELQKSKDNFIIRKISKNSDSEVWKHFGEIFHNSGSVITDRRFTNKIFCIHCFSKAEKKNPKFKRYVKITFFSIFPILSGIIKCNIHISLISNNLFLSFTVTRNRQAQVFYMPI